MRSPVSLFAAGLVYLALMLALGGAALSAGFAHLADPAPTHVVQGGEQR